jgi:N,N-dimethylformamidase
MIVGRMECGLAQAEWRLLAWLEREGFAYDLYAEADLENGVLDVNKYRAVILNCHPEYVTRTEYRTLERWVEAEGGRLLYLGGNGLDGEIVYDDPQTPTAMRVRNMIAGASRPGWGGGADPRQPGREFATRIERTMDLRTAFLGVVCTPPGIMTSAPYRVIAADHWIFQGTGLREGDEFGAASQHERCPGGASGHETDKITELSPPGCVALAKGTNPDDGGAEIVFRETPSGGAVFSVGSITWPSSILVDDGVSRITANVLTRFLKAAR